LLHEPSTLSSAIRDYESLPSSSALVLQGLYASLSESAVGSQ
jgi:hypothetical protein